MRAIAALRRGWRDRRGAVAIYVGLMTTLLMGTGVLVFDFGRVIVLKSQMQNAADSAALSAAVLLDGRTGAMDRATSVATSAVSHGSGIGDNPGNFTIASIEYFSEIDPSDVAATSDVDAVFVRITLNSEQITLLLQPILAMVSNSGGVDDQLDLQADATAALAAIVCNAPPFMACDPGEDTAGDELLDDANIGRQLVLKSPPGGASAPGNFGLLCPSEGNCGANNIEDTLGEENEEACYSSEVTTSPGVAVNKVKNGINTRFDDSTINPSNPAQNIMEYPQDSDMGGATIVGNGDWDPEDYWDDEHAAEAEPSSLSTYSRYQMYLYELGESFAKNGVETIYPVPSPLPSGFSTVTPAGASIPAAGVPASAPSTDIKRRVFKVAVLQCTALGVAGSGDFATNGRYIEVFLTEKAGGPPKGEVFAEIIGPLSTANSDEYHFNVQLFE